LSLPVHNRCEADVHLQRTGGPGPEEITLPARSTTLLRLRVQRAPQPIELQYTATNFWISPEQGLSVTLKVPVD